MEVKSLIKDDIALTPESLKDPKLILGHNTLNPLLSPHSQDPVKILEWLNEHVVDNPYFDPERASALRNAVAQFYATKSKPIEGVEELLDEDGRISLVDAFAHPGIQAKTARLHELFKEIGPVVRATQEAVRAVRQQ